ncbi:family 20 glycosylhydrolase [Streptomyces sp. NPDC101133]|uniref:family 20 glycosylhydrolase n=1 Tax=Streptomyces sp. NPDC101133 TaxID=3366111 RepID=UPI0038249B1E
MDLAPPTPEAASRVLGAQGQLWTEFVRTPEHIEYLTHPRLCALADRVWAGGRPPVVPPHRAPPTEASAQAGAVPKGTA